MRGVASRRESMGEIGKKMEHLKPLDAK